MKINIHIDELILEGFPSINEQQFVLAVQGELARLLSERGAPPGFTHAVHVGQVDAGSFELSPVPTPGSLGTQVAGALAAQLYSGGPS
jgi:hypothetical protein